MSKKIFHTVMLIIFCLFNPFLSLVNKPFQIYAQSASGFIPEGMNMESRVPSGTIPMSSMDLTKNQDFTGNVSIPVPLLSLGGVDVLLKYYSKDISNKIRTENQYSPSGAVGIGWEMVYGSISAEINNSLDISDDKYYYNGPDESFELKQKSDGTFYMPDYKPWKIKREMSTNDVILGWEIIKEDGTIYRFGNYDKDAAVDKWVYDTTGTKATRFMLGYNGLVSNVHNSFYSSLLYIPYQWDISNKEDVNGNYTTITYQPLLKSLSLNGSTSGLKYTGESYPHKIIDNRGGEVEFIIQQWPRMNIMNTHNLINSIYMKQNILII